MNGLIKFRKVLYVLFVLLAINFINTIFLVAHQLKNNGVAFEGQTITKDVGKRAIYGEANDEMLGIKAGLISDGSIVTFFNSENKGAFLDHKSCLIFNVKIESKENTPHIQHIRYEFDSISNLLYRECNELNDQEDYYHQGR